MQDCHDAGIIGKVTSYDNACGTIIAEDMNEYMFLESSLDVRIGDLVKFRPEQVNGINMAHFVERLDRVKQKQRT